MRKILLGIIISIFMAGSTASAVELTESSESLTSEVEITAEKNSTFTIGFPIGIEINGQVSTINSSISVRADIDSAHQLVIESVDKYTREDGDTTDNCNFFLKNKTSNTNAKDDVLVTVSQNKSVFVCNDFEEEEEREINISIQSDAITAGVWKGVIEYKVAIADRDYTGLYDDNNNLLCTWKDSGINASRDYAGESYKTENSSGYYVLANRYPSATKVVVSDKIDTIGENVFAECTSLKTVLVPENITSISPLAFNGCEELSSIEVSSGNPTYDSRANCNAIINTESNEVVVGCMGTTIPDGVVSIGPNAFYNCTGLTELDIPDSVASIQTNAFYNCTGLESITLMDSVTTIGEDAFKNVPFVYYNGDADGAPWGALKVENIPGLYDSQNNLLCTWNMSGLDETCSNGQDIVTNSYPETAKLLVHRKVTTIANEAFKDCSNLVTVSIPDTVETIGSNAFNNCSNLSSATVYNKNASIGGYAFNKVPTVYYNGKSNLEPMSCKRVKEISGLYDDSNNLICTWKDSGIKSDCSNASGIIKGYSAAKVVVDDSVTTIANSAFYNCSSLKTIVLYDNITTIGDSAFCYCNGLEALAIPKTVTRIGSGAFSGCSSLVSISLPNNLTSLGSGAFSGCGNLTAITIPNSVKSLNSGLFSGCSNLVSVSLPEYVNSMDSGVFSGCSSLSAIAIPNGVTTIYSGMFGGCDNLAAITIPNSVTRIESGTFSGLRQLVTVAIPSSVSYIGSGAFSGCNSLTALTIPKGVTKIESGLFYGCSNLVTISIPNTVTEIGDSAFSGCDRLTAVTIPESVTKIGSGVFSGCSSLVAVSIPYGITKVNSYMFSSCNKLTSVAIPDSITSICSGAFKGCGSLTELRLPDSITIIEPEAFHGCRNLKELVVPDSVSGIGVDAFYGVQSIVYNGSYTEDEPWGALEIKTSTDVPGLYNDENELIVAWEESGIDSDCSNAEDIIKNTYTDTVKVVISDNVTKIGDFAFNGCDELISVFIPASVTSIGEYAFDSCSSLASIIVPGNVSSIGNYAFSCSGIKRAVIINNYKTVEEESEGTIITKKIPKSIAFGESVFSNCCSLIAVALPYGINSADNAFNGCNELVTASLPDSITNSNAFYGCYSLKAAALPDCNSNYTCDFYRCDNIEAVSFTCTSGFPYSLGGEKLKAVAVPYGFYGMNSIYASSLKGVSIPSTITGLDLNWIDSCPNMRGISLPGSVSGFSGLQGLEYIEGMAIPSKVRSFSGFSGCSNLKSVSLSGDIQYLSGGSFYSCSNLKAVAIPDSIQGLDSSSFAGNAHIYYSGSFYSSSPWGATAIN